MLEKSKFTDAAWEIMVLGQDQAEILRQNYIGSEHIRLGFLSKEEGPDGLTVRRFREELVRVLGDPGPEGYYTDEDITRTARAILNTARDNCPNGVIDAESLWLAMVDEIRGVGAHIMRIIEREEELDKAA